MIQIFAVLCSLWVLWVLSVDLSFWPKAMLSLPPALIWFGIIFSQFYFAWNAWRSHWFNKTDFLVNEFLKAIMGDLPYRKLMARHRLRKLWLCRYCYCPPTTNQVSEGFPEELYFVTESRPGHRNPRDDLHEGTEFGIIQDWPERKMQFLMNDIHLTIERTTPVPSNLAGDTVPVRITVVNSLVNDLITINIDPTTANFNRMMTILSKWQKNPNFSFLRSVYREIYYGHCYNIQDFFEKADKGELNYVMVQVPFGTRVLVGGTR